MIKLAKQLGFSLEELKQIAAAKTQQGLVPMDLLVEKIGQKRQRLVAQQAQIQAQLQGLTSIEQGVAAYNACLLENITT